MVSRVLELRDILTEDKLAVRITEKWIEWDMLRQVKKQDWEEIRRYIYATDTRQTSNSKTPWKNSTTIPKLCQIRDNLYANYTATLFPQRKWLLWEANEKDSNSVAKRDAITNYMSWVIEQPSFKEELDKVILDFIDYGNCIATVEWIDQRAQYPDGQSKVGYVGPGLKRWSPLDTVMNPTSDNYLVSPKIFRTAISMGELKELLQRMSNDENRAEYEELYKYLKEIRRNAATFNGDWSQRDNLYSVDGFTSFREYLKSDMVEVLTFYGDIYDPDNDIFYKNHVITVVDRHKLIGNKPNPSYFGYPPIFHAPWRKKQDNLWGMGPLDNLVGMQYRLDHIENMRADIVDTITYPVQKIKGFVEDFTWQPGEKIYVSEEGDVELVQPDVNVLQANFDLQRYEATMEQMAGAPREAVGFRTPGEKTKYEVQALENAASRVFQNKITQFEEKIVEPILNAMLELARRNMNGVNNIRVFDDELKVASFQQLTAEDITGIGRIKPIAARHFAEKSQLIQNLTNLTGSQLWPAVQQHFSGVGLAKMIEDIFDLKDYGIVLPYIALAEQADAQKMIHTLQEQIASQAGTATGLGMDADPSAMQAPPQPEPTRPVQQ